MSVRRRSAGWLAAALAAAPLPALAQQCNAPGQRIESDRVVIVYRTTPPRIAVGKHFAVEALVCAKGVGAPPTGLRVDAAMPEHRHGMNYRARVLPQGEGRYRAEGLLFHMPGRWQLLFDVDRSGGTERLAAEIVLE
jgi:hypothetical protein